MSDLHELKALLLEAKTESDQLRAQRDEVRVTHHSCSKWLLLHQRCCQQQVMVQQCCCSTDIMGWC